jgi:hypothetical protein
MIFMVVATIIGAGPVSTLKGALPIMIVFWLIAMNLFISPANSMIETFAPAQKLPIVMGVLILITEILYALEPVIVALVSFFGDTITFIVGGVLIAGTGYLFQRVSSNEVITRRQEMQSSGEKSQRTLYSMLTIVVIGLALGVAKAVLVEYFPEYLTVTFPAQADSAAYYAFSILGFSAILSFAISRLIVRFQLSKVLITSFLVLLSGVLVMMLFQSFGMVIFGAMIIATSFSLMNISGLPFALNHLNARHVTLGVGLFIGASEVFTGIVEYYFV